MLDSQKVNRKDLISKLKENRDKHQKEYEELYEQYKATVVRDLKEMYELAESGKKYTSSFRFDVPENYTAQYDKYIEFLEMAVEDEVELSISEFTKYVKDEWEWKHNFDIMKATYSAAM